MNNKRFFLIITMFFLPLLLTILQSCNSCFGEKFKQQYFDIQKMYAVPISGADPYQAQNNVSFFDFKFFLRTDVIYYTAIQKYGAYNLMACSPPEAESKEIIADIRVVSDADFPSYPAGTNLAPIMLASTNNTQILPDFLAVKPQAEESLYLSFVLTTKVVQKKHNFTITYIHAVTNETFVMLVPDITFI